MMERREDRKNMPPGNRRRSDPDGNGNYGITFSARLRGRSKSIVRSNSKVVQQHLQEYEGTPTTAATTIHATESYASATSPRRKTSGLARRLRSRSRGVSKSSSSIKVVRQPKQEDDEPAPPDNTEKSTTTQIAEIIDRHQLSLKMDIVDKMDAHEKEIRFWKSKSLKLKKRLSQEPSLTQESQTAASSNDDNGVDFEMGENVAMLRQEVETRDVTIEMLRAKVEMQEKASEERVQMLESQLERLVEMKTTSIGSATSTQLLSKINNKIRTGMDKRKDGGEKDLANEVSILEQLLARVLAEKDKLLFENQNLKSVMKETKRTSSGNNKAIPPEREGSRKENIQGIDNGEVGSLPFRSEPTAGEEEDGQYSVQYAVQYKMSCRTCLKNHSHIEYTGKCAGTVADTQQLLKSTLEQHFSQIWDIVQEEDGGSISSSIHPDELLCRDESNNIVGFQSSSLARHIAKHCQSISNETDVAKWCKDNIRVEICGGVDTQVTRAEKKKKKDRKQKKKERRASLTRSNSLSSF